MLNAGLVCISAGLRMYTFYFCDGFCVCVLVDRRDCPSQESVCMTLRTKDCSTINEHYY